MTELGSTSNPVGRKKRIKLAPPNLNYPGKLEPIFMVSMSNGYSLYNYLDEGGAGKVLFTVLVSKVGFPAITDVLEENQYVMSPLYDKKYNLPDGTKMEALIFEPFRTISDYLEDRGSEFIQGSECHEKFKVILKGMIEGAINLLEASFTMDEISSNTLVVTKNGTACVLYPFLRELPSVDDIESEMSSVLKKMRDVLKALCIARTGGSLNQRGLVCLFYCMGEAETRNQCMRLLNAPLFLTDEMKITWLIPQASDALWSNKRYGDEMSSSVVIPNWEMKVRQCKSYPEMVAVLEHDDGLENEHSSGPKKKGDTGFAFLRFLRSGTQHVNQKKYNIGLSDFNKKQFQSWDAKEEARKAIPRCSKLMTQMSLFVDYINDIFDGFIELLFEASYDAKVDIEMLDVKLDLP